MTISQSARVIQGVSPERIPWDELLEGNEPVVLKGVVRDWPLAQAQSAGQLAEALMSHYGGQPVTALIAPAEHRGRYGYTEDAAALDFRAERGDLGGFLGQLVETAGDDQAPTIYIGSTDVDQFFPGLREHNDLALDHPMFDASPPMVGAWIGNRTVALAHHDISYNMACCLVGRRRFTLFPPGQVANLYPGPLEPTPGGQVITMADIERPDLERFPRLAEALRHGQVAELEPGDALYYPAMWWHQVQALDEVNLMINYWWNLAPDFMDSPQTTLLHAMLSLRDRPEEEKRAWRALFEYYVFGRADQAAEHLPEAGRGFLAPFDELTARRLRATVLRKMNR